MPIQYVQSALGYERPRAPAQPVVFEHAELDPEEWYQMGLFEPDPITQWEARERINRQHPMFYITSDYVTTSATTLTFSGNR